MSSTPDYDVLIVGAGFSRIGAAIELDPREIHQFRVDRGRRRSRG
jgi:cation diffusion facilitator CzcD-associated flavoprotein CzcO